MTSASYSSSSVAAGLLTLNDLQRWHARLFDKFGWLLRLAPGDHQRSRFLVRLGDLRTGLKAKLDKVRSEDAISEIHIMLDDLDKLEEAARRLLAIPPLPAHLASAPQPQGSQQVSQQVSQQAASAPGSNPSNAASASSSPSSAQAGAPASPTMGGAAAQGRRRRNGGKEVTGRGRGHRTPRALRAAPRASKKS